MESEESMIEYGSGNVFADLGFPNPEEHLWLWGELTNDASQSARRFRRTSRIRRYRYE